MNENSTVRQARRSYRSRLGPVVGLLAVAMLAAGTALAAPVSMSAPGASSAPVLTAPLPTTPTSSAELATPAPSTSPRAPQPVLAGAPGPLPGGHVPK